MVEPIGDAVDDRAFQRLVIEHCAGQERRQHRIVARGLLRFDANAREQRIVAAEADQPGRRLLRHSNLLKRRQLGRAYLSRRRRAAKLNGPPSPINR
jgi:hypothetical protein